MTHEGYIPNQSNVLRMLGYFSLIGQLRVSSVLSVSQVSKSCSDINEEAAMLTVKAVWYAVM